MPKNLDRIHVTLFAYKFINRALTLKMYTRKGKEESIVSNVEEKEEDKI